MVRPMTEDDDVARIFVCQGPPRCDLHGDEAVAAQEAGCPFCRVIYVDTVSGDEWEKAPHDV